MYIRGINQESTMSTALPSKSELLAAIKSGSDFSLFPSVSGKVSKHIDANDVPVQYASKPYWSVASSSIEEMMQELSGNNSSSMGYIDEKRSKQDQLETQRRNRIKDECLARQLGREALIVESTRMPDLEKLCMFFDASVGSTLDNTVAVCDTIVALEHDDSVTLGPTETPLSQTHETTSPTKHGKAEKKQQPYASKLTAAASAAQSANVENSMMRVGSKWSFVHRNFSCTRESCAAVDVDAIVSGVVPRVSSKSSGGAGGKASKESNLIVGLLRGITSSGDLHIRPLCTPGDLSIALREISDPSVFRTASISLPSASQGFRKEGGYDIAHHHTYYRMHYQLNKAPLWVRMTVPDDVPAGLVLHRGVAQASMSDRLQAQVEIALRKRWKTLRDFLCPHMHSSLFCHQVLDTHHVPQELTEAGQHVVAAIQKSLDIRSNEPGKEMLMELVVDFQHLEEVRAKLKTFIKVGSKAYNHLSVREQLALQAEMKAYAGKMSKDKSNEDIPPWGRHYRVHNIIQTKTSTRVAHTRRGEVHSLSGRKKLFLTSFAQSFQEEFSRMFVESQVQRLSSIESAQNARAEQEKEEKEAAQQGRLIKRGPIPIPSAPESKSKYMSRGDDIEYNTSERSLLDAAEVAMRQHSSGKPIITDVSQLPPAEERGIIHTSNPMELMTENPLFKDRKFHLQYNKYNQEMVQRASREALEIAEKLWSSMKERSEDKQQQKERPVPRAEQIGELEEDDANAETRHLLHIPERVDTETDESTAVSRDESESSFHDPESFGGPGERTLSYLAEYMQKALETHISEVTVATHKEEETAPNDDVSVKHDSLVVNDDLPVGIRSVKIGSESVTVARVGAQMQARLGHAQQLPPGSPPSKMEGQPKPKSARTWEKKIPEYITFLNLWEKFGKGQGKKRKSKQVKSKKSGKKKTKGSAKTVPGEKLYRNPVNRLISPRLDLEAQAAKHRKKPSNDPAENIKKLLFHNAEEPPREDYATVESVIRAPKRQFATTDGDEIIAADELARDLSLTDLITGSSRLAIGDPLTSSQPNHHDHKRLDMKVSIAEAVRSHAAMTKAAEEKRREQMVHEAELQKELEILRKAEANKAESLTEKTLEEQITKLKIPGHPLLKKEEDEGAEGNERENLDLRREIDPAGDWPDFRSKMDKKFYPYVSYERPLDNEKMAKKAKDALGAKSSSPRVEEPTRYNSTLADERERESHEILELFLSFMPSALAHQIRTGISKRARMVYLKRRSELKKQKRSGEITREEEFIDYFNNTEMWQYLVPEEPEPVFDQVKGKVEEVTPPVPEEPKVSTKKRPTVIIPKTPAKKEITRFLGTMVNLGVRRTLLDGTMVIPEEKKFTISERLKRIADKSRQQEVLEEGSEEEEFDDEDEYEDEEVEQQNNSEENISPPKAKDDRDVSGHFAI